MIEPSGLCGAGVLDRLGRAFLRLGDRAGVRAGGHVLLHGRSEPLWGIALLAPHFRACGHRLPGPADILLLVEVARPLHRRRWEERLAHLAAAGILECWAPDAAAGILQVHRCPSRRGYRDRQTARRGEVVAPVALPGFEVAVDRLLP